MSFFLYWSHTILAYSKMGRTRLVDKNKCNCYKSHNVVLSAAMMPAVMYSFFRHIITFYIKAASPHFKSVFYHYFYFACDCEIKKLSCTDLSYFCIQYSLVILFSMYCYAYEIRKMFKPNKIKDVKWEYARFTPISHKLNRLIKTWYYWAVQAGLLTPLTFARHHLSPLAAFTSGAYFLHNERWWQCIWEFYTANFKVTFLEAHSQHMSGNKY